MHAEKLQIKLFAAPATSSTFTPAALVPVFHDWIRRGVLPELMIDVASYEHVPHGPSVLFVGHGSDYFYDEGKGQPGLLYSRKRQAPPPGERLADAVRRAVHVAHLLEAEPTLGLKFATDRVQLRINDRLAARNDAATLAALRPELDAFFGHLFAGGPLALTQAADPRELFTVTCQVPDPSRAPSLDTLLERVGGPPR